MKQPVSYLQTEPQWANWLYSNKGEHTTIAKSGCGPTCMAMVIATLKDSSVTPLETCRWALEHGYKATGQGTYYSYFNPQGKVYGIDVTQINGANLRGLSDAKAKPYHDKALSAIKDGNMVICCMGPSHWTKAGHFILWYDIDGSKVLINDPNSKAESKTKAELSLLQKEVKYYFIVTVPKEEKKHSTNYYSVQKKYGFDDNTMAYLESYKYADSLFALMLQDINNQKYQVNTINYILEYKYGREVFARLLK